MILLPCWWGVTLADPSAWNLKLLLLFALGATVMRGAGCTFNDWVDQDIDRQVSRTRDRPLAKGELSSHQVFRFFAFQCLVGLVVVLNLPKRCWPLSLIGLALLGIYPFMKRLIYWPQLILGLAFNFGVIFGAVAVLSYAAIDWPLILSLYGAGIAWTLGYDTLYALQDKEDDLKIGVKSTAIYFGDHIKSALVIIYGVMFGMLTFVGYQASGGVLYYGLIGLGALAKGLYLMRLNPTRPKDCLKAFRANMILGWLVWLALLVLQV